MIKSQAGIERRLALLSQSWELQIGIEGFGQCLA